MFSKCVCECRYLLLVIASHSHSHTLVRKYQNESLYYRHRAHPVWRLLSKNSLECFDIAGKSNQYYNSPTYPLSVYSLAAYSQCLLKVKYQVVRLFVHHVCTRSVSVSVPCLLSVCDRLSSIHPRVAWLSVNTDPSERATMPLSTSNENTSSNLRIGEQAICFPMIAYNSIKQDAMTSANKLGHFLNKTCLIYF